ncbi:MAG: metallophosphoesterase family protein [Anaerolineae bacterium]|nr:metallophosphoesterase family protein [Anaerolineae bacterium]
MTTISERILPGALPQPYPEASQHLIRTLIHHRLTATFEASEIFPFDNTSRFIFFSDVHRGDNSRADAFAPNEPLFIDALAYYFRQGFHYVEVGDGDELWKNRRFHDVENAHPETFEMLHTFNSRGRLHLVLGNHDIHGPCRHRVDKGGLIAKEGLVLKHAQTGQSLFVTHGHQADIVSDRFYRLSRLLVRRVWRKLQVAGLVDATEKLNMYQPQRRYERHLLAWIEANRQFTICGHTHRATTSSRGMPPYFNSGSCVVPGELTGLEITKGEIALIRWTGKPGKRYPIAKREVLAPPRPVLAFHT